MISQRFEIANGWNSEDDSLPLDELYDCFLKWITADITLSLYQWNDYEARILDGNRRYKPIGLPWVSIKLPAMTEDEHYQFKEDFDEEVTVQLYNRTERLWKYYNGVLVHPENPQLDEERLEFVDIIYEIRELQEI